MAEVIPSLQSIEDFVNKTVQKFIDPKIIFCGDFNCRIGVANVANNHNYALENSSFSGFRSTKDLTVNDRGHQLLGYMDSEDFLVLNGRSPGDSPANYTFVSGVGKSVIDLAWVNHSALELVTDLRVRDDIVSASDHFPVELVLSQQMSPQLFGLSSNSLKWSDSLKSVYSSFLNSVDLSGIDFLDEGELLNHIYEAIYTFADRHNLKRKFVKKSFCSWADEEYKAMKRELRELVKVCKENDFGIQSDISLLHSRKADLLKLKRSKIKNMYMEKVAKIRDSRNMREFWENIRFLRQGKKGKSGAIPLDSWVKYYRDIFPPREQFMVGGEKIFVEELDSPFTMAELEVALKSAKLRKAAGKDGIPVEYYKNLTEEWKLVLLRMFNKVLESEKTPASWSEILVSMLYKKGDEGDPDNYRPIALVNAVVKLFTFLLYIRLENWVNSKDILPEFQAGFRRGRGTSDNIFVLNALIQKALNTIKGKLFVLFVDFRRAFPSLNHLLLWFKLKNYGISTKIIRILASLYSKAMMFVKIAGSVSEGIDITEGVLQGDILSPLLFAIFLADLEAYLKAKGISGVLLARLIRIILLAYADDIALFALNWKDMELVISALRDYCEENSLTLNTRKTNVVIFKKGGRNYKNTVFPYGDEQISIVDRYEYLGIVFDSRCLFQKATTKIIASASSAACSTRILIRKAKLSSFETINSLFDSLVSSVVLYGAHVWAIRHLDALDKLQTNFYKKLFLLPPNSPNYAIRTELDRFPLSCMVFKRALSWISKVLTMDGNRYPRIALDAFIDINREDSSIRKYNWLGNIKALFFLPIGEEIVFEDLNLLVDEQRRSDLFHSYVGYRKLTDYEKCLNSSSLVRYPALCDLGHSYLNLKNDLLSKAFVSQLKLLNKYNNRLIIQGSIYAFRNMTCHFCNLNCLDIHHFLFDCPLFYFTRKLYNLVPKIPENDTSLDHPLINLKESSLNNLIKLTVHLCKNELSIFVRIF